MRETAASGRFFENLVHLDQVHRGIIAIEVAHVRYRVLPRQRIEEPGLLKTPDHMVERWHLIGDMPSDRGVVVDAVIDREAGVRLDQMQAGPKKWPSVRKVIRDAIW